MERPAKQFRYFYSRKTLRARRIVYKQRETLLGIKKTSRNKAASVEDILTVDYKKNKKELSNGGFEGKTLMPFVPV